MSVYVPFYNGQFGGGSIKFGASEIFDSSVLELEMGDDVVLGGPFVPAAAVFFFFLTNRESQDQGERERDWLRNQMVLTPEYASFPRVF